MDDFTRHVDKFKKNTQKNEWIQEESIELETLKGETLTISRIIFKPSQGEKHPGWGKRCISISKNGKSVAFDIELSLGVAGSLQKLSNGFIPKEWLV